MDASVYSKTTLVVSRYFADVDRTQDVKSKIKKSAHSFRFPSLRVYVDKGDDSQAVRTETRSIALIRRLFVLSSTATEHNALRSKRSSRLL